MNENKIQNKYLIGEHLYQIKDGKIEKFEVITIRKSDKYTNEPEYFLKNLTNQPYHTLCASEEIINKNYSNDEDFLMVKHIGKKIESLKKTISESEQKILDLEIKRKEYEY